MKISKQDKAFSPITLVIETQAELDYLYALSNTPTKVAKAQALELDFKLSDEVVKEVQMPFYYAIRGVLQQ